MSVPRRKSWFGVAMLIGALYGIVGIVFALPSRQVHFWRLSAWVVSAALFAAHIGYEHFCNSASPIATALHAAMAVALGAFLLAVAATIHKMLVVTDAPYWRFLLALVLWPIITALPAFLVALAVSAALALFPTKRPAG